MSAPFNNGQKIYTLLVEYNTRTGLPTGRVKPNLPMDPDYIAPSEDLELCPLPGEVSPPTIDILVDLGGYTATIHLKYGVNEITRNFDGIWTVVDRTYDFVVFDVVVGVNPSQYDVKIEYGSGAVQQVTIIGDNSTLLTGPYIDITKISVIPNAGDYNIDYGNDYYN